MVLNGLQGKMLDRAFALVKLVAIIIDEDQTVLEGWFCHTRGDLTMDDGRNIGPYCCPNVLRNIDLGRKDILIVIEDLVEEFGRFAEIVLLILCRRYSCVRPNLQRVCLISSEEPGQNIDGFYKVDCDQGCENLFSQLAALDVGEGNVLRFTKLNAMGLEGFY